MYFCKIGPKLKIMDKKIYESPDVLILEFYSEGLDEERGEWRLPRLPDGTW